MPRKGYTALTIDDKTYQKIGEIGAKEGCVTKSEIVRFLVREYARSMEKKRHFPDSLHEIDIINNNSFCNSEIFPVSYQTC